MSTRALYTFTDAESSWNVYKHHDGYPSGAADTINAAVKWFAWQLPRFEANEFAAAFCAAGKACDMVNLAEGKITLEAFREYDEKYGHSSHGGGVRFMPQGPAPDVAQKHCPDIEYRYEIGRPLRVQAVLSRATAVEGKLHINAYAVSAWEDYSEKKLFTGTLDKFTEWARKNRHAA